MKSSEILRSALLHLSSGREDDLKNKYICDSINDVLQADVRLRQALKKHIHSLMGPGYFSVENWLRDNVPKNDISLIKYGPVLQNYRKRWVKQLIAEFQAKGD